MRRNDRRRTFRIRDAFGEAAHALGSRPLRSLLSALTMVVAVAAVIATLSAQGSAASAVQQKFADLGSRAVTFTVPATPDGTAQPFPPHASERLSASELVEDAADVSQWTTAETSTERLDGTLAPLGEVALVAVSPSAIATLDASIARGRGLTAFDDAEGLGVALVGTGLAAQIGMDDLSMMPTVIVDGRRLQIVGVVQPRQRRGELGMALWVADGTASRLFDFAGVTTIEATARDGEAESLAADGPAIADPYEPGRVGVDSAIAVNATRRGVAEDLGGLAVALSTIVLAVGGIGVGAMTMVNVHSRRHELALRRAVGARSRDVFLMIAIESLLLGVSAAALGVALGLTAATAVASARGWPIYSDTSLVVVVALAAVTLTGFAGFAPAASAARASPMETLRESI